MRQIVLAMMVGLALVVPSTLRAHHLVPKHTLACGSTFPCPPELQRRIDFWIEVFATWGDDKLIMHDSSRPELVFSVVESSGTMQVLSTRTDEWGVLTSKAIPITCRLSREVGARSTRLEMSTRL